MRTQLMGLILAEDQVDRFVQKWKETYNPDDLFVGETRFVTCETASEGVEQLRARFPCPADVDELKFGRVTASYDAITVTAYPYINSAPRRSNSLTATLVSTARTYGAVLLNTTDIPGRRSYGSDCDGKWARGLPGFNDAGLIVSRVNDARGSADLLRLDPKRAAAVRKGIATKDASYSKRNQEAQEKRARAEKIRHAHDRFDELDPIEALWESVPILIALASAKPSTPSWEIHPYERFRTMVRLHEALTKVGEWRKVVAVRKWLLVFHDQLEYLPLEKEVYGDSPQACPDTIAWLTTEAARAVRCDKRDRAAAMRARVAEKDLIETAKRLVVA